MTRIKQSSTITNLRYALKELHCNKCGSLLKWKTNFSDINQPKYLSTHCNQDFVISIATVRVETQKVDKNKGKYENAVAVRETGEQDPNSTKKVLSASHNKDAEPIARKRAQVPTKDLGSNRDEGYNKDKKDTKHYDRELILPSDSNVVKGNV
jgi:transposase-like protein